MVTTAWQNNLAIKKKIFCLLQLVPLGDYKLSLLPKYIWKIFILPRENVKALYFRTTHLPTHPKRQFDVLRVNLKFKIFHAKFFQNLSASVNNQTTTEPKETIVYRATKERNYYCEQLTKFVETFVSLEFGSKVEKYYFALIAWYKACLYMFKMPRLFQNINEKFPPSWFLKWPRKWRSLPGYWDIFDVCKMKYWTDLYNWVVCIIWNKIYRQNCRKFVMTCLLLWSVPPTRFSSLG